MGRSSTKRARGFRHLSFGRSTTCARLSTEASSSPEPAAPPFHAFDLGRYVKKKIDRALEAADSGDVVSHEVAKRQILRNEGRVDRAAIEDVLAIKS